MPKRCKSQIVAQILTTCRGNGASKTRIATERNLNFNAADLYLDLLIKKRLLEDVREDIVIYKTTAKGERALESLRMIVEIYS